VEEGCFARIEYRCRSSACWLARKEVVMSKGVRPRTTQLFDLCIPFPCAGPACQGMTTLALIEPQEDLPGSWRLCPLCVDCVTVLYQTDQAMRRGAFLAMPLAAAPLARRAVLRPQPMGARQ